MVSVSAKPREFRNLLPLPCIGTFSPNNEDKVSCVFLGPDRLVCQERVDGSCIGRGLIPAAVPTGYESALCAAMEILNSGYSAMKSSTSMLLVTDRNGGIYDNFDTQTKRLLYEQVHRKETSKSPYHTLVDSLEARARKKVCGLLVELADTPAPNVLVLGGAVLIAECASASNWRLDYKHTSAIKAVRGSAEAQLVKCAMDEVVGIALATNFPVVISSKLYEVASVDGLLSQDSETLRIEVAAPYFSTVQEADLWAMEQPTMTPRNTKSCDTVKIERKAAPRAEQITDATTFLRMSTLEKRDVLRATGVRGNAMPRPREGKRAVDALLIPLLDEEVVASYKF